MSDQINSINELLAKAGNVSKAKKTDKNNIETNNFFIFQEIFKEN